MGIKDLIREIILALHVGGQDVGSSQGHARFSAPTIRPMTWLQFELTGPKGQPYRSLRRSFATLNTESPQIGPTKTPKDLFMFLACPPHPQPQSARHLAQQTKKSALLAFSSTPTASGQKATRGEEQRDWPAKQQIS
ncbi:hypothetical protein RJZ56_007111 [Blastomyces dermatitidis]